MADTATYLYAITDDAGGVAPAELTGVAGTDVYAVDEADLRAYVSSVPLAHFSAEALRRNLEDLAWLEETARAHHGVVEAVARTASTAPVRLVTVYRDDEQVRRMLDRRADEFKAVIGTITGRSEWGVKVYATREQKTAGEKKSAGEKSGNGGGEKQSPGTAYLKRRQSSLRSRENVQRRALSRARDIDDALCAVAAASRRHRPQDPQLSGRNDWMVLNGAYLVDDERGEEFAATVESLRDADVDIQVTGPWAPYSFAVLESVAEPDAAYDG